MENHVAALVFLYLGLFYFVFGFFYFALPGIRTGTIKGRGESYNFRTNPKMYMFCVLYWVVGSILVGYLAALVTVQLSK